MAAEARFAQPANLCGLQLFAVRSQLPFEPVAPSRKTLRQTGPIPANASNGRYAAVDARRLRRQGKLNSARADRMMENVAVIPNARSIHTKKKASLELPISPPITPRVPFMWMTGM